MSKYWRIRPSEVAGNRISYGKNKEESINEAENLMILKRGFCVAIVLLLSNVPWTYPEKQAAYVGWSKCAACHSAINDSWKDTRHAKAIESLKKTGQETLPACVKCHVTAFELDGGFVDYELTPEMAGVQCEVCHGPGSEHMANPTVDMKKDSGADLCRQCHTKSQDPGFNYEEKVKEVHGKSQ
jgi:predicted CXXCH cytochrome family protein